MRRWIPGLALLFMAAAPPEDSGLVKEPPQGFSPLFNAKDLAGWHGMPHFDPRKLAAMSPEDRSKSIAEWTEDARKHWSVDPKDGSQGFHARPRKVYSTVVTVPPLPQIQPRRTC